MANVTCGLSGVIGYASISEQNSASKWDSATWNNATWSGPSFATSEAYGLKGISAVSSLGGAAPAQVLVLPGRGGASSLGLLKPVLTNSTGLTGVSGYTYLSEQYTANQWDSATWDGSVWGGSSFKTSKTFGLTSASSTGASGIAATSAAVGLAGVGGTGSAGLVTSTIIFFGSLSGVTSYGSISEQYAVDKWDASSWDASIWSGPSFTTSQAVGLQGQPTTSSLGNVALFKAVLQIGLSSVAGYGSVSEQYSVNKWDAATLDSSVWGGPSFTTAQSFGLAGISASGAAGSVSASESLGLSGVASTLSVGSVTALTAANLSSASAQGNPGLVGILVNPGLSGLQSVGSTGAESAGATYGLQAVSAIASVTGGQPASGVAVAGNYGVGAVGVLGVISGYQTPVTGVLAASQTGSTTVGLQVALYGTAGAGAAGQMGDGHLTQINNLGGDDVPREEVWEVRKPSPIRDAALNSVIKRAYDKATIRANPAQTDVEIAQFDYEADDEEVLMLMLGYA